MQTLIPLYGNPDAWICPHTAYGCSFTGTEAAVRAHVEKDCPFNNVLKRYIGEQALELQELRKQFQEIQLSLSAGMNINKMECIGLGTHSGAVVTLATYQNLIFSGAMDGMLRLTEFSQGGSPQIKGELKIGSTFQLLIADGVVFCGLDSQVLVLDSNLTTRCTIPCNGPVKALRVINNFLFAGSEGEIRVFYLNLGNPGQQFVEKGRIRGHEGEIRDFVALLDARGQLSSFLSCGDDGFIKLWDGSFRPFGVVPAHRGSVRAMVPLEVNVKSFIVTGSEDTYIKIWEPDFSGWKLIARVPCLVGITALRAVTIQGRRNVSEDDSAIVTFRGLISGHNDGTIRVWSAENLLSLTSLCFFRAHNEAVRALAVFPPGFISGSYDGSIKLWTSQYYRIC